MWVFGEISCQHHIDNFELQSNKEKLYRNGEREKDNSSGGEGFPPFQSNRGIKDLFGSYSKKKKLGLNWVV